MSLSSEDKADGGRLLSESWSPCNELAAFDEEHARLALERRCARDGGLHWQAITCREGTNWHYHLNDKRETVAI